VAQKTYTSGGSNRRLVTDLAGSRPDHKCPAQGGSRRSREDKKTHFLTVPDFDDAVLERLAGVDGGKDRRRGDLRSHASRDAAGGKAERVGLSAQIEIAFDPVFYAASNEFVWLTQLHDMTST